MYNMIKQLNAIPQLLCSIGSIGSIGSIVIDR